MALEWFARFASVRIDGRTVGLTVEARAASDAEIVANNGGPIDISIHVPLNTTAAVISQDAGFGHGWAITFVADPALAKGHDSRGDYVATEFYSRMTPCAEPATGGPYRMKTTAHDPERPGEPDALGQWRAGVAAYDTQQANMRV